MKKEINYNTNEFKEIVLKSKNYSDICRNLNLYISNGNIRTIKKYIKLYNLDILHFKNDYSNNSFKKRELEDILVENSTYASTCHLKDRLYKEGLKERKCEKCGQDENWNGEHISLILDHINGKNNDNRIENLRILCPNCNATLDTNCRGYEKLERMKNKKNNDNINRNKVLKIKEIANITYCECGNIKSNNAIFCQNCYHKKNRKVERPSLEQLEQDVKKLGYSGTGRKYNVSDTAIRKWIKQYNK